MPEPERCNHWLVGAKVSIPGMYDIRCTREKGHPHEQTSKGYHLNGSEGWSDGAGEYR